MTHRPDCINLRISIAWGIDNPHQPDPPSQQDLSEVWGLHTSTEGETFDLDGVNPDDPIPWDLDDVEVERLRAASQGMSGGVGGGVGLEGLTPASDARTLKGARGEIQGAACRPQHGLRLCCQGLMKHKTARVFLNAPNYTKTTRQT